MASLIGEIIPSLGTSYVIKSAEQAYFGNKTIYSTLITESQSESSDNQQKQNKNKLQESIAAAKKVVDDALAGQHNSCSSANLELVRKDVAALRLENQQLRKDIDELRQLLQKVTVSGAAASTKPASAGKDEDFDLFGSDSDEDKETEEQKRIREERLAAYAAKKLKKPGPIAKSSVILDVKPWDDETDLKEMEKQVRSIELDGLLWGAAKFVPIGYGIQKLQIVCTIEDEKVSVDSDLVDRIQEEFADYVQSVDIVAFNKI